MKLLALPLILCSSIILASCSQDKNKSPDSEVYKDSRSSAAEDLSGRWELIDVNGEDLKPFNEDESIHFVIKDSLITGYNGCNRMNGTVELDDASISFGPMAVTRMMCPDMDVESKVMNIYKGKRLYLFSGDTLKFLTVDRNLIARFRASE